MKTRSDKGRVRGIEVGKTLSTHDGDVTVMKIEDSMHITVRFKEFPYETVVQGAQLRNGWVKNRMRPEVCGVGFIGDGPHPSKVAGKILVAYQVWRDMLRRVHAPHEECHVLHYANVVICEEWYNYQNFANWYYKQSRSDNVDFAWVIDKDLRQPGNRIYCPDTCAIIPNPVNSLMATRGLQRGELPLGVIKDGKKYSALCCVLGKRSQRFGTFNTIEEAHGAYWIGKFETIHKTAEVYRSYLPDDIFQRLRNFNWEDAFAYYGQNTVLGLDTFRSSERAA